MYLETEKQSKLRSWPWFEDDMVELFDLHSVTFVKWGFV